ncbi:MAG TPA: fused MFS/spermidine synthase [Candidatus Obscuribacterales bacterium]
MDATNSADTPAIQAGQQPGSETQHRKGHLGFALIVLLFVASGLSSLIYQVVWTRLLVLVFGSTTFATATVLAVFMGGLALGSYLAGRVSDRLPRPFLWYGILEGIIGAWALIVPFLFDAAVPLYRHAWQQFHLSVIPFSLLRFVMATVILIVPTSCMGATLPLLSRFVTTSLEFVGRRVGTLYSANTLGAVAGAMVAGFALLPTVGLEATTLIAALVNFALCGIVLLVAPRLERMRGEAHKAAEEPEALPLSGAVKLAIAAFAVSGAVAMIYEVGWTRTLLMVIGSSTYAFTVMLATFLVGIFAGSLICARFVDRLREPLAWFAMLEFLVCLFGLSGIMTFNFLPWWNLSINAAFPHDANKALLVRFLLSSMIMVPLTLCLGAIFPVVVKVCTRELEKVGRSVGTLYSANTLGAIVGAFLAGFALVPAYGVEKTLIFASVANLLLGAALLIPVKPIRVSVKAAAVLASLSVAFWCVTGPSLWDRVILLSCQSERRQLIKQALAYKSFDEFRRWLHANVDELFWEDGASSTVGVAQYRGSRHRSLVTNGHVDASDGQDMKTQILLAAYPLLWKPDAEDVALVGWGSGVSTGTATLFPVKSVTGIELEPAVLRASKFFHHVNHRPEENKLVRIEYNDGRNFLLATGQTFDIIVSEPSNPWQAGVCNLFTREYFQICRQRLKPGGIFSFWLQTVEIPPENLKGILAALNDVFPHTLALMSDPGNLVVLASDKPLVADLKRLRWLMTNAAVVKELKRIDITSAEAVLARMVAAPDGLRNLSRGAEPNIDDTNRLEYAIGKTYETTFFNIENSQMLDANAGGLQSLVKTNGLTREQKADLYAAVGREALVLERPARALLWADASLAVAHNAEALRIKGIALYELGRRGEAGTTWDECIRDYPRHIETLQTRGMVALREGKPDVARKYFLKVLEIEPFNLAGRYHMAQTYAHLSPQPGPETALSAVTLVAQPDQSPRLVLDYLSGVTEDRDFVKRHPDVLYMAGVASYQVGRLAEAEKLIRQYLEKESRSVSGNRMLGCILFNRGAVVEANSRWFASFVYGKSTAQELFAQGNAFLKEGKEDAALGCFGRGVELWPGDAKVYSTLASLAPRNPKAASLVEAMRSLRPIFAGEKKD